VPITEEVSHVSTEECIERAFDPHLEFGPYIYAGDWSSDEFRRPQVIDLKNTQIAVYNTARNVTARIKYTQDDGTTFTLTEAPWFTRIQDGSTVSTGIHSSVDLAGNEGQPLAFLLIRKDGTPWVYKNLTDPIGLCSVGHWIANIRIASDNAGSIEESVGFTVLPVQTLRYDHPALRSHAARTNA
jgi:hypothetical protein